MVSSTPHDKNRSVYKEAIRGKCSNLKVPHYKYEDEDVLNMYETGILFWIIPRKNYAKKGKKWQAQGNKGMKKYPISLYVAINLKITRKTPLGVIGNSNNPCYFLNRRVPLPYFFKKILVGYGNLSKVVLWNVLTLYLKNYQQKVFLIMDNYSPHVDIITYPFGKFCLIFLPTNNP